MKRYIATGVAAASLLASCAAEKAPEQTSEKARQLVLTTEQVVYPYYPDEVGPKGSGDLGQADKPLSIGQRVIAECVNRPDSDTENTGITDSVIVLKGAHVPLQTHLMEGTEPSGESVAVFDQTPDQIRNSLEAC